MFGTEWNHTAETQIENETTQSPTKLEPILGAVAGCFPLVVLAIAITVIVYCKKKVTHTEDPVYDYIDTDDGSPMQPISYSLETATNTAYGTT